MKKWFLYLSVLIIMLNLSGCVSSKHMRLSSQASFKPEPNESLVIFMRPSSFGGAIQSSVFDITTSENKLVGIVSAKKKVAYKVSPGEHFFMVIGESADFMKADLSPGKTYYALVTPRMGWWKARFSLKPVPKGDGNNYADSCKYVENTDASYSWAKENSANIQSKREDYLIKWNKKPDADKPILNPEDGM